MKNENQNKELNYTAQMMSKIVLPRPRYTPVTLVEPDPSTVAPPTNRNYNFTPAASITLGKNVLTNHIWH